MQEVECRSLLYRCEFFELFELFELFEFFELFELFEFFEFFDLDLVVQWHASLLVVEREREGVRLMKGFV